jgi:NAD-dependent deacetylase
MRGLEGDIERAAELILSSSYVTALTGAGVSVESGIPPFRGPGGLWTRFGEPSMDGYRRFLADPKRWWKERLRRLKGDLARAIFGAKPNLGHYALAELERLGVLKTLITQNIDDLHNRAGSRKVLEIHGNIHKLRCIECLSRFPLRDFDLSELPPRCPNCGGLVKSDTVMFGEPIPRDILTRCLEEAERSDCMLVVGTSAVVYPAAGLPLIVKRRGGLLIEVNPNDTELSGLCDLILRVPSGLALPQLVEEVRRRLAAS